MLLQSEVCRYLVDRQRLAARSLVDGDVQVTEASRRNRNFKVIADIDRCYLLKQGGGLDGRGRLAHEDAVYAFFNSAPSAQSFQHHVPLSYGYDEEQDILILELLRNAQDLREFHTRRGYFPTRTAASLGHALSMLHSLASALDDSALPVFPRAIPWVLSLHRPGLELFQECSSASLQLIKILQNTSEFPEAFGHLGERWQFDAPIHNDIKWDNCLSCPVPDSKRKSEIKLIDWEFASFGDRDWDAGAAFSNYLAFWLFSIPFSGEAPPERFLELARYPLHTMHAALRAYWQAYISGMNCDTTAAMQHLLRAAGYAGARLVQTAFEYTQHATLVPGNVVCLLQLALNIMQRPWEATVHLFGIPSGP